MDDAKTITEGSRVTTRYFGGYEAVIVRQVHEDYLVVARMGGAAKNFDGGEATGILPVDQVEKVTNLGLVAEPFPIEKIQRGVAMTDEHLVNKAEAFLKHGTAPEILPGDEFSRLIALARKGAATLSQPVADGERIENALQAASETHSSWKARCYAIMAGLEIDVGSDVIMPDEITPEEIKRLQQCERDLQLLCGTAPASPIAGEDEATRLKSVIEHDRSKVADILAEANAVLKSYWWLAEGRGSYEFDDDRWKDEFKTCMEKLVAVFDPMRVIAGDLSDSPIKWADIEAARKPIAGERNGVLEEAENVIDHQQKTYEANLKGTLSAGLGDEYRFGVETCRRLKSAIRALSSPAVAEGKEL